MPSTDIIFLTYIFIFNWHIIIIHRSGARGDVTIQCVISVHICHLRYLSGLHVGNIQQSLLVTWDISFLVTVMLKYNIRSCSLYPDTPLHALCVCFLHLSLLDSTSLFYYTIFYTWDQICSCHNQREYVFLSFGADLFFFKYNELQS